MYMLDLNRFNDTSKSEILHTSAHARVARGEQIGAAGSLSFQKRLELLRAQGRTVGSYRQSSLGVTRGALRAKQIDARQTNTDRQGASPSSSRQSFSAGTGRQGGFVEPPSRGYNPYA